MRPPLASRLALLGVPALLAACAGAGAPGGGAAGAGAWEGLATPRPSPLEGAPRIAVAELDLVPASPWGLEDPPVPPGVGVAELVAAGLLDRRDVHFVERRRFSAAAEREQQGLPRPEGAPPLGTSPGAEYLLAGGWTRIPGQDRGVMSLRLVEVETGAARTAWRVVTGGSPDPVGLARAATGSLLATLDTLGMLPAWQDPEGPPPPPRYVPTGVDAEAFRAFLRGVAAEDRYRWERARIAYQRAAALGGASFPEPTLALARAARLRAGGTLGGS